MSKKKATPTSVALPSTRVIVGGLLVWLVSIALTVSRPARLPRQLQRAADVGTGTALIAHPVETLLTNRRLASLGVGRGTRAKVAVATMAHGVFAALPAVRSARKMKAADAA